MEMTREPLQRCSFRNTKPNYEEFYGIIPNVPKEDSHTNASQYFNQQQLYYTPQSFDSGVAYSPLDSKFSTSTQQSNTFSNNSYSNSTTLPSLEDSPDSTFSLSIFSSDPLRGSKSPNFLLYENSSHDYSIDLHNSSPYKFTDASSSSPCQTLPPTVSNKLKLMSPLTLPSLCNSESYSPLFNQNDINKSLYESTSKANNLNNQSNQINSLINNTSQHVSPHLFLNSPPDELNFKTSNHRARIESRKPLNKKYIGVHNNGLDNEDFDYICYEHDLIYNEEQFLCYEVLNLIGHGTFGHVYSCIEKDLKSLSPIRPVALKIIKNLPQYHDQALSEVRILNQIANLDPQSGGGFVKMFCNFYSNNHLCIVTEILKENMYQILKKTQFNGLPLKFVQQVAAQMINNAYILEQCTITHGDIKPENILIEKFIEYPELENYKAKPTFVNYLNNSLPSPQGISNNTNQHFSNLHFLSENPPNSLDPAKNPYAGIHNSLGFDFSDSSKYNQSQNFSTENKEIQAFFTQTKSENLNHEPRNDLFQASSLDLNFFLKIKLIDFGSAHTYNPCMLSYIQSRFYRAPEVLLGLPSGSEIDIWSLGCLVFELLTGLPLFPGTSEFDQLQRIIRVLGFPPSWMIERGQHASNYFYRLFRRSPTHSLLNKNFVPPNNFPYDSTQNGQCVPDQFSPYNNPKHYSPNFYSRDHGTYPSEVLWGLYSQSEYENLQQKKELKNYEYFQLNSLSDLLDTKNSSFARLSSSNSDNLTTLNNCVDFLTRCLKIDPNIRIKPADALKHPFIKSILPYISLFQKASLPRSISNFSPLSSCSYPEDDLSTCSPHSIYQMSPITLDSSPPATENVYDLFSFENIDNLNLEHPNSSSIHSPKKFSQPKAPFSHQSTPQILNISRENKYISGLTSTEHFTSTQQPYFSNSTISSITHNPPSHISHNRDKKFALDNLSPKDNYHCSPNVGPLSNYGLPINNYAAQSPLDNFTLPNSSSKFKSHYRRTFGHLMDITQCYEAQNCNHTPRLDNNYNYRNSRPFDKVNSNSKLTSHPPNSNFVNIHSNEYQNTTSFHSASNIGWTSLQHYFEIQTNRINTPHEPSREQTNEFNTDHFISMISSNPQTMDWNSAHSPYLRPQTPHHFVDK